VQGTQPETVCRAVIALLEGGGYEMIEWSKEYPTTEDPSVKRVFLTAIRKEISS
jgi:hypothetical protein